MLAMGMIHILVSLCHMQELREVMVVVSVLVGAHMEEEEATIAEIMVVNTIIIG